MRTKETLTIDERMAREWREATWRRGEARRLWIEGVVLGFLALACAGALLVGARW